MGIQQSEKARRRYKDALNTLVSAKREFLDTLPPRLADLAEVANWSEARALGHRFPAAQLQDCLAAASEYPNPVPPTLAAAVMTAAAADAINPGHYKSHPSGIECIQITEHMNFNLGNAVKYLWRCDEKGDPIENLRKSRWYIDRELKRRGAA